MPKSISSLLFPLVIACTLSGCTSQPIARDLSVNLAQIIFPNLDLPEDCSGHSDVPSPAKRCMTRAEYDTARKKAKNSRDTGTTTKRNGYEDDPELSEVIPGEPASRPTNPCGEPGQIKCSAAGDQ